MKVHVAIEYEGNSQEVDGCTILGVYTLRRAAALRIGEFVTPEKQREDWFEIITRDLDDVGDCR